MNLAGFHTELDPDSSFSQGSIHDAISDHAQPDEDRIIAYLDQGHALVDFTETTQDVIDGKEEIVGGSSLLSDNVWIWRVDLSHYVRKYHLQLPDAFANHIRAQKYSVPERDRAQLIQRAQEYFGRGE